MSPRQHRPTWLRSAAAVGCVVALAAGCASSAPPVEAVPALGTRLAAVDRAIADHEYRQARRHIQRLVEATVAARESGQLEPDEAEPILTAATSLSSALPEKARTQPPSPAPEPAPDVGEGEQAPEPEHDAGPSEEQQEKRQEQLEKKREELQKKREEQQQKDEEEGDGEGGGEEGGRHGHNGDSSENGPDDGHGN